YDAIKHTVVSMFSHEAQLAGEEPVEITVEEGVARGWLQHETIAYYVARVQAFLIALGIKGTHLRFRQHLPTQLAHYARDCWDAEINSTYGWIECVGIADRSCFDLECHTKASGQALVAYRRFDTPKEVAYNTAAPVKKVVGKTFRREASKVVAALEALEAEAVDALKATLEADGHAPLAVADGTVVDVTSEMVEFSTGTKMVHGESFTPAVCEPSFGIGRILYMLLEHAFYTRDGDDKRTVFKFEPGMAPTKVVVLPISAQAQFTDILRDMQQSLSAAGVSNQVDASGGSIGRRYLCVITY
ncbi:glycyl-tRNA synthetase, partial [Kipferlia bialata]